MINKELKNKAGETEILTADDKKLHQLLGGLKKVNAPKNFDFQLKARIANAKPQNLTRPYFLPFLRYALPMSVVVLLAGFVFFNLSLSTGNQDAPKIADNFQPIQNETAPPETVVKPPIEDPLMASTNANKNSADKRDVPELINTPKKPTQDKLKYIAVKNPSRNRTEKVENDSRNNGGGSRDITSRDAPPLFERNNNANSTNTKSPSISQHKLSLREVLLGIGIEADYAEKSWKIISVEENSVAMRAKLKVGDLIVEIDGKKLSSDTAFLKNFNGRIFYILRDGKQMIIDLTAK